jgi:hypothetical protein
MNLLELPCSTFQSNPDPPLPIGLLTLHSCTMHHMPVTHTACGVLHTQQRHRLSDLRACLWSHVSGLHVAQQAVQRLPWSAASVTL